MLAVLSRLAGVPQSETADSREIHPVALAPEKGPLADELKRVGIEAHSFDCRDSTGRRWPREILLDRLAVSLEETRAGLLHANSLAMGRLSGALSPRLTIPTSCHLRDIIGLSATAVDELNGNRRIVAVSEATKSFHAAQGVGRASRRGSEPNDSEPAIDVIRNGVDLDAFQPRPRTGSLLRELRLPGDSILAATIGQIALRKGQDVLARAAVSLAAKLPKLHYLLIGERHSTKRESIEFDAQITAVFHDAGIRERLHRLGRRNDVASLLNEVDLLVHPARQEPLGRVLLEAAASGTPIIATNVGGTAEILRDGVSARLIPPDDPEALAVAIRELAELSERRIEFIQQARLEMERRFDIRDSADAHARFWRRIVK